MSSSHVRSAERVLDILTLVADARRAMSTAEIAEELELPKSTTHHLVNVMYARGFLTYLADRRLWAIGASAFSVGSSYAQGGALHHDVEPYLAKLTKELNMTSHLALLQGTDVVYLAKREPQTRGVRLVTEVGTRLPAHLTAVGRALLGQLETGALEAMYSRHDWPKGGGPESLPRLESLLAEVREQGSAVERGNTTAGIACVATPLVVEGRTLAAIGVAFVEGSRSEDDISEIAGLLRESAHHFAKEIARKNQ